MPTRADWLALGTEASDGCHFRGKPPEVRGLYERLLALLGRCGPFKVEAHKTQIMFQVKVRSLGAPVLLLLKQDPRVDATPGTRDDDDTRRVRIRCPRCSWEPRREDRWMCLCFHVWNTFETGGVCPACGHTWRETQCLRCHEWSRHEDWYVEG